MDKLKNELKQIEMKKTQAVKLKIRPKITWELEGEKCTKYFFEKLEKRKNADQAILSLKSRQNSKILKDQQEILAEVTQPAIACSKLTIETLEQGVKYVQS